MTDELDPADELEAIRRRREIARRRPYRRSQLERYRAELVALRRRELSRPQQLPNRKPFAQAGKGRAA